MYFLLQYNRSKGELVSIQEYVEDQRDQANDDRLVAELAHHRDNCDLEVVLLEAQDLASLQKTHRRYFESLETLARFTAGNS